MRQDFRERRASYDTHHVGARLSEGVISIWNTKQRKFVASAKPGFKGGRQRYAIDPFNHLIYSGTWEDGLTCFDYGSDRVVWHRDDLVGIQRVEISGAFPTSLFVTLEAPDYRLDEPGVFSGAIEIEAKSGKEIWRATRGDNVYAHPEKPILLIQRQGDRQLDILNGERKLIGSAAMLNFAILDVAFGSESIALAEGAKGTRVIDYEGKTISENVPDRKPNCIDITFDEGLVCVFDSWEDSFVTLIDPASGKAVSEYKRDSHGDICFVENGSRFVDFRGRLFRTRDGKPDGELKAQVQE